MRYLLLTILSLQITPQAWAFSWSDIWSTPDRQAQIMMNKGQFAKAEATFDNPHWQAFAAFRAGHYKKAASLYGQLKNNHYNQGNALAHSGQLEAAIEAYNRAIANNPADQDAIYNRKIIEDLLKKQKQQQDQKQDQDQKDQDKQNQEQKDQEQKTQEQKQQDQQNQQQEKKDKQSETKQKQHSNQSPQEREQKYAKEQWLKLVPDDPGGLMREKFLRDYLRRQQG